MSGIARMSTQVANIDGFGVCWTTDGENYRYAIYSGSHIVQVASGSGHEDNIQPTEANMKKAVQSWVRMTTPTRAVLPSPKTSEEKK